jgi:hypothetical protein
MEPASTTPPQGKKLLDQARDALRTRHYFRLSTGETSEWLRTVI